MQKILNKIIIIIFFLITACASSWEDVKKGLGGQKRTSTDEFLVKKKDPLVMPPKWKDLPSPGQNMKLDDDEEEVLPSSFWEQDEVKAKTAIRTNIVLKRIFVFMVPLFNEI